MSLALYYKCQEHHVFIILHICGALIGPIMAGEQVLSPYPSFVQNSTPKVSQENEGNRLKYDSTSYCNVQHEKMARSPVENSETTHITKRVGVWMVQSCEYLVSILAILKAGFIFIPLDPSWPMGRLQRVLQSAKLELLLGCKHSLWAPHSLDLTKSHELELAAGCRVLWLPEDYIKSCNEEYDAIRIDDGDGRCAKQHQRLWCYVLHTSGSSGIPKGVCGTEKGIYLKPCLFLSCIECKHSILKHVKGSSFIFLTSKINPSTNSLWYMHECQV